MKQIVGWSGLVLILVLLTGCIVGKTPTVSTSTPTVWVEPTVTVARPTVTTEPSPTAEPTATLLPEPEVDWLSAGDPYAPELGNRGYDVQRYDLALMLDPQVQELQAQVIITAVSQRQALNQVSLDFAGLEIDEILVNGQTVTSSRQEEKLLIDLPQAVISGTLFNLEIAYHGVPAEEVSRFVPFVSHLGLFWQGNRVFALSEPDGAHYWFPCNDHPRDKATYRVTLTVPEGLLGISNGRLVESETGIADAMGAGKAGDRYVWDSRDPMPTAFFSVVVGDYVLIDGGQSSQGVPLRYYVRPAQKSAFMSMEKRIGPMLDWMSEHLGAYPFESFGYVTVPMDGASLEVQTMVLLDDGAVNDENTMAHEMVHMWFGDWVSVNSWTEIWRSEGGATYLSLLWVNRDNPEQFEKVMARLSDAIQDDPREYALNEPPAEEMFGRDSYIKGAVVFHALHQELGDEVFFAGLKAYFERYGGGTASDAEFWAVMEAAAGHSLDEFIQTWFERVPGR